VVASTSAPVAGVTSETPGGPDAPALAAEPGAAAAPSPAVVAPRAGQPPAAHPLRQALAAIAAAAPTDATSSTAASQPAASPAPARTAAPVAPAPASDTARAGAHEGRTAAASRVDAATVTPAATFGAASDAGAAGDGSSDGAHDGFAAAASTLARAAESRLDLAAAFPSSADAATAVALPSVTGFGAGFGAAGDTMLRAIDLPAAARFEQTLSSVDPDVRNLQAMVRTVRLFTSGAGVHEARLNLEPEHLGPVALTVRVEQGSVSAHFRAETPAAQRWIETHQQELRAGLREQGLEVKDVVVTTDPDGRRDRQQHAQPARPSRPRRPQDADAPRFEVLV
jgi:flagellar hook-length control protein FliK